MKEGIIVTMRGRIKSTFRLLFFGLVVFTFTYVLLLLYTSLGNLLTLFNFIFFEIVVVVVF